MIHNTVKRTNQKEEIMKDTFYDEQNGLYYTRRGDFYYPDLAYSKNDYPSLGKYGMLRKTFLQEHYKTLFSKMLLRNELWPHLLEVDEQAHAMLETMVKQMAKAEGVTESLKSTDPLHWVGLMNNFKSAAEEIILRELVYA